MRLYVVILLTILFVPNALHAQSYHVYRPLSNTKSEKGMDPSRQPLLEIYGDGVYSVGKIKDGNGDTLTKQMFGGRAGLRVGIGYNLMLGVEGEKIKATDQLTDAISKFRRQGWQATVKWTFTPETEPKLYILAGFGRVEQKAHLSLMPSNQFNGNTQTIMAGVGGEVKIWERLYFAAESRVMRDTKRWSNFVFTAPWIRYELSAGVHYLF